MLSYHQPNKGVKVTPLSKKNIQKYALMFRSVFQENIHQPFDVLSCLEVGLAKATQHEFNFDLQSRDYMGMTEAAVLPDKKLRGCSRLALMLYYKHEDNSL